MNESDTDSGREGGLDWKAVHQRLADVRGTMEESAGVSVEELRRVWARRAAELARAPEDEDEGEHIELLMMRLGREAYGVEARYVYYVKVADLITRVPRVPDWVAGVVNLRGRILSVLDLRHLFKLPSAEVEQDGDLDTEKTGPYLVVVEAANMEIALLVDDVLTVESMPVSQIQDVVGTVRGLHPEYVLGVVARNDVDAGAGENGSVVVVLNLVGLLSDERLVVHEEIV
jgi:purine-binding chemotaxis protein CheW